MTATKRWPFSKPSGPALGLTVERLSSEFKRLDIRHTLTHQPYRFRFELEQPSQLLIKVSSNIANTKGWYRAGYLAHILQGAPILAPISNVERVYFGQQHIAFPWTGLGYYLEFWPHVWISDYRVEVWAREAVAATTTMTDSQDGLLSFQIGDFNSEPFTFFGESIVFP